jgi:hypothetical protein
MLSWPPTLTKSFAGSLSLVFALIKSGLAKFSNTSNLKSLIAYSVTND